MKTLYLRFARGEALPRQGEDVIMRGLAGLYRVRIRRILSRSVLEDDATVLKVQATRRLMIGS